MHKQEIRCIPLAHVLSTTTIYEWKNQFTDLRKFAHQYVQNGWKRTSIDYELESFVHSTWNFFTALATKEKCSNCGGSGTVAGRFEVCGTCRGSGRYLGQRCPTCDGTGGTYLETQCPVCHGTGEV